jgi:exopolysaccharide biosynthesis polyprenyl glycosylphosphotransferase
MLARKIAASPQHGIELTGFVHNDGHAPAIDQAPLQLGPVTDFEAICRRNRIERVLIAFSGASYQDTLDIIRLAKRAGLKISVVPRLYEVIGQNLAVDEVEGMTMLTLRGLGRSRSSLMIKRAIDIAGALVGLLVLAPLMLVVACVIKLTSRGPILYSAVRMGRDRPFRMHKFRTMVDGADAMKADLLHLNEASGPMFKIADDPRVTGVGGFLRRTSVDELPQLWNVLRGEMSLVGPRPLIPDEDDQVVGWQRARLELTPGLTGPWQVAGRTAVPFTEMVTMDYLYVAEWSLFHDIKLLLRTLPVVWFARGR